MNLPEIWPDPLPVVVEALRLAETVESFQRNLPDVPIIITLSPFAMDSYKTVAAWAETIREVVEDQRMPPWHANPKYGHFANDGRMTEAERKQIFQWVDDGVPEGSVDDLPPQRDFVEGWALGKPDLLLTMPRPITVSATGVVDYQYMTIDPGFTEGRWVRASEIRPGVRSVVHHIIVFINPPGGKTLATGGDDGAIFLCNALTGETQTTLLRHRGAVSAVVFARDGQTLVSGCDGGDVKVWNTLTGQERSHWREHRQQIYCASISPDGKWLVTGGGNWTSGDPGELIVWELTTGRVRARIEGHKLAVWSIVFDRDGTSFVSSDSSGAVKVWNMETLQEEHTLQHPTWVRALALSPDGNTLAVGRGDGSVRLWDTKSWTERASCDGHQSFCFALQFAPNGKVFASSGNDGTVRFWKTGP